MSNISDYKSIAKANILFGGVKIYTIVIGIIRSKLVAVLLGAEGMGIMGLLSSTTSLVGSATNMGLGVSAVRDVSLAQSAHDDARLSALYSSIGRLVWLTGLLGTAIVFLFAKELSCYAFASDDYTLSFRLLSVVMLIGQLTTANQVMLQGMRKLHYLGKNTILGSTLGLLLTIPLYYLYGKRAIVASMIIASLISYFCSSYYLRKLHINKTYIPFRNILNISKPIILLGIMLSLTSFMDVFQAYILRTYISRIGGISEVGLYNAGYGFVTSYVGLVFSSISTDYYPRLASVGNSPKQYNEIVNNQMELMLLVLVPLVLLYLIFSKQLIVLFYTEEFKPIVLMTNLLAFGMILRAVSWCPGFLYVAKGDKKLYLTIYIVEFSISTILYILLYHYLGLTGVGIAFVLQYIIGSCSAMIVTRIRYKYIMRRNTGEIALISIIFVGTGLVLSYIHTSFSYILMGIWIIFSILYSYKELDKRINLGSIFRNLQSKGLGKNNYNNI